MYYTPIPKECKPNFLFFLAVRLGGLVFGRSFTYIRFPLRSKLYLWANFKNCSLPIMLAIASRPRGTPFLRLSCRVRSMPSPGYRTLSFSSNGVDVWKSSIMAVTFSFKSCLSHHSYSVHRDVHLRNRIFGSLLSDFVCGLST